MANDLWRTPPEIINYIEWRFGEIAIDLCSSDENKVCDYNITEQDDLLHPRTLHSIMDDWHQGCHAWINCPYSNPLPFMKIATRLAKQGYNVSGILNADTSTKWFDVVLRSSSVIMPITGKRISFLGDDGKPAKGNNKPQFMFHMPAFGPTARMTDYIHYNEIFTGQTT